MSEETFHTVVVTHGPDPVRLNVNGATREFRLGQEVELSSAHFAALQSAQPRTLRFTEVGARYSTGAEAATGDEPAGDFDVASFIDDNAKAVAHRVRNDDLTQEQLQAIKAADSRVTVQTAVDAQLD